MPGCAPCYRNLRASKQEHKKAFSSNPTSCALVDQFGAAQVLLGTPGDLPETVKNIHEKGFVPPEQAPSMFVCSAFSIVAGTS